MKHNSSPFWIIGLKVTAILALCAGILFDRLWLNGLSFVVLFIFLFYSLSLVKRNPASAAQHADNVYFLGYLLTIVGVAGIAYTIALNPSIIEDPRALVHRAAFALSSTIVGLFGMIIIRNFFPAASSPAEHPKTEIKERMDELAHETREFIKALQKAQHDGIQQLNKQLEKIDLVKAAEKLEESIGTSARAFSTTLTESNAQIREFNTNVKELAELGSKVVSPVTQLKVKLETLVKTFDEQRQSLQELGKEGAVVEKLNPVLKTAAETLEAIGQKAEESKVAVKSLDACISQLEFAVAEFVKFTQHSLGKGLHGVPPRPFGSPPSSSPVQH